MTQYTWKGIPLEEMSREELIEALKMAIEVGSNLHDALQCEPALILRLALAKKED